MQKTHCFDLLNLELARRGFDTLANLPNWQQSILYVTILAGLDKVKRNDEFSMRFPPRIRFIGAVHYPESLVANVKNVGAV